MWETPALLGMSGMRQIHFGDCADLLPRLPAGFARLMYIDPPFNTGSSAEAIEVMKRRLAGYEPSFV